MMFLLGYEAGDSGNGAEGKNDDVPTSFLLGNVATDKDILSASGRLTNIAPISGQCATYAMAWRPM